MRALASCYVLTVVGVSAPNGRGGGRDSHLVFACFAVDVMALHWVRQDSLSLVFSLNINDQNVNAYRDVFIVC